MEVLVGVNVNLYAGFQWHIDKLANYGIYIHRCIDGFVIPRTCNIVSDVLFRFSRKILWLHVEATKANSKVVLGYYLATSKVI